MSKSEELIAIHARYGAPNYHPLPIVLREGKGATVIDVNGKKYLDFLSCYSALNFGHQHPSLVAALKSQVDKLSLSSRAFHNEELCLFEKELVEFTGSLEAVLPMNTGTEAVETALKGARRWGYQKKRVPENEANIITMAQNFHGRSVTIVSFSTDSLYRDGFGPYTPGFKTVPFGDIQALERAIDKNTVGVLLEPIQAEAGILVPPPGYLKQVRDLTSQKKILMMLDEIQTGLSRTGKDFCYQHEEISPDVLILGKSLGGGLVPLSAVVSSREFMDVFSPGSHGSTFGGNPLACHVGRESLRLIRSEKLSERSVQLGHKIMAFLTREKLPKVKEIRGKGALIGIEMQPEAGGARRYCEALAEKGVLCKETHDHVIRLAPPLVITDADLDRGLAAVVSTIQECGK